MEGPEVFLDSARGARTIEMALKIVEREGLVFWVPDGMRNAAFTSREGGRSLPPFNSLNVGERTGDDLEKVRDNRRTISRALGISDGWLSVRQVHGGAVAEASEKFFGQDPPEADAITASEKGPPLAVVTADCLPIVLAGRSFRSVVHAGWRGLCAGVIDRTIDLSNADSSGLRAAIGPSIGPCHYEVGAEVPQTFKARYPEAPRLTHHQNGKVFFDLRAAARWILRGRGVLVDDYEPPCTFCDLRFFSYRRDGVTGRQAVLAW